MSRAIAVLLSLILLAAGASAAGRQLTWGDLVPPATPLANPFGHLSPDQRADLETIARLRAETAAVPDLAPALRSDATIAMKEIEEFTAKLQRQGLDVDGLLAQLARLEAEIELRNAMVVGELHQQDVRLGGFALPLDVADGAVSEFLLVPYMGACIHVPPPPPNQMVLVRLERSWAPEVAFAPVLVTGRMTVERTSKALNYVDGEANVVSAYVLDGAKVEPYRRSK